MMPDPSDTWGHEVRSAALIAVRIAAAKRTASDRAFTYFLRAALAHGVDVNDVAKAAGVTTDAVLELTDPGVAA